jgi:hypothetical protein
MKDGALLALLSSPAWMSPGAAGAACRVVRMLQHRLRPGMAREPDEAWAGSGGIPGRMVAAVAADKLEHVAVAAFWLALHDPGRLASQNQSPVISGLTTGWHACLLREGGSAGMRI